MPGHQTTWTRTSAQEWRSGMSFPWLSRPDRGIKLHCSNVHRWAMWGHQTRIGECKPASSAVLKWEWLREEQEPYLSHLLVPCHITEISQSLPPPASSSNRYIALYSYRMLQEQTPIWWVPCHIAQASLNLCQHVPTHLFVTLDPPSLNGFWCLKRPKNILLHPNHVNFQIECYIYIYMRLNMIMKSFNQFDFGHKHAPLIMDWNESKTIVESKQLELKGDFIA